MGSRDIQIRRSDTGEIYESIKLAADKLGVPYQQVQVYSLDGRREILPGIKVSRIISYEQQVKTAIEERRPLTREKEFFPDLTITELPMTSQPVLIPDSQCKLILERVDAEILRLESKITQLMKIRDFLNANSELASTLSEFLK